MDSARGSSGGFWLSRPPDSIRVAEVMRFFQRAAEPEPVTPLILAIHSVTAPGCAALEQLTIEGLRRLMDRERPDGALPSQVRDCRAGGPDAKPR